VNAEDLRAASEAIGEQAEELEALHTEVLVWRRQFAGMIERVQLETAWRITFGESRSFDTFLETLTAIRGVQ
jgi:hypothetical protein